MIPPQAIELYNKSVDRGKEYARLHESHLYDTVDRRDQGQTSLVNF